MKTIHLTLFTIILMALSACSAGGQDLQPTFTPCPTIASSSAAACPLPTRTPPALPAGALFQVLLSDGKAVPFTQADLGKLNPAQVSLEGKTQPGYLLQDILAAAGVSAYSQLIFNGDVTITLTKDQVNAQTALVVASGARLVAAALPADQQVVNGVTTIRVK